MGKFLKIFLEENIDQPHLNRAFINERPTET